MPSTSRNVRAGLHQSRQLGEPADRGHPPRGGGVQSQVQRGDDTEGALGADEQRRQVVAGVVPAHPVVPAQQRPVGQRHLQANDLLAHVAVPDRAQAAGVRRRHPPDGRRVPGGQVHAEHQGRGARGALHRRQRGTGADPDAALDAVDLIEGVQTLGGQQHVVVLGHGAGHQRGAPALHRHVRPGVPAHPQHLADLLGRTRAHQRAGPAPIATGVVDAAAGEYIGIGDDVLRSHNSFQVLKAAWHARGYSTSGRCAETALEMTVLDPDGLHERVGNDGADQSKPRLTQRY